MLSLCETVNCRRQYLLNYFAEDSSSHCGACDAYEVCATRQEDIPMVTVDSIGKLTRKKVEFDSAAIKARNKKEAEEATGLECANYEEV